MKEKRINDYIELMNKLLGCPSEEGILEILHTHSFLIDEGFLKAVEVAAVTLKKEERISNWLLSFAAQLSTAIEEFNQFNQEFNIAYQSGNYSKSSELAEQALQLAQSIWGNTHSNVASSLNNLAVSYRFQGFYKESEYLYE